MQTPRGNRRFYRFQKPADDTYPAMLELVSRIPDALSIAEGSHLTPIPIRDEVASLSAILLDEQYYTWIQQGRYEIDGLPLVGPAYLVALKARAWLDLRARKQAGESVDRSAIKKHKNDVFRLFQVLEPGIGVNPPSRIVDDMRSFLEQVAGEYVDLKALGLRTISVGDAIKQLGRLYAVNRDKPREGDPARNS